MTDPGSRFPAIPSAMVGPTGTGTTRSARRAADMARDAADSTPITVIRPAWCAIRPSPEASPPPPTLQTTVNGPVS